PRWRRETLIWGAIAMPLAAIATVYVVWPRLWPHPIESLAESFHRLSLPHTPEPYLGNLTNAPPAHYFLVYLMATLPVGILAGVAAGAVRVVRSQHASALIVLAWFIIPLAAVFSPVRQDGVRYVMPCVLALAMIAAAGLDQLATWARHRHAFAALAAAALAYQATTPSPLR